jgi:lysine-specific permease
MSNWVHTAAQGDLVGASAPFPTSIGPIISMFLIAAFSFQGTELIGLSAGEAENPDKSIPKAINSVFWRIVLFYIGGMFVIGTLVPFDDPHLMAAANASSDEVGAVAFSPFTLVFNNAGFSAAANFMNFVFMTSVLSCGNSGLFCATRMLYGMANEGKAPKIFSYTNKRGVPLNALLMTAGIAAVGFFTSLVPQIDIYNFLLNASGMMGMFGWVAIAICHYRFRRAYIKQGNSLNDLVYKAKFFPVGPIIGMILCTIVVVSSEMWVFTEDPFSFPTFLQWYWPLFTFGGCWIIYKLVMKSKVVPLEECDFSVEYKRTERVG